MNQKELANRLRQNPDALQSVQLLRRVMSTPDGAALAGRIMQQLQQ